jgi:hypothetical protein
MPAAGNPRRSHHAVAGLLAEDNTSLPVKTASPAEQVTTA